MTLSLAGADPAASPESPHVAGLADLAVVSDASDASDVSAIPGIPGLRNAPASPADRLGLRAAALSYIEDRHWDVVPGTSVVRTDGAWACSCGDPACQALGAHPAHRDWGRQITAQPSRVHAWWDANPEAAILLPTGRAFDVLDVPEQAGCLALARLERGGVSLGPVAATPTRRLYFFVLPGAKAKLPELLVRSGWGRILLDLRCHGEREWVLAPPSRMGVAGQVQWARPPGESNRWLPEAGELVPTLAYACGRERS